MIIDASALIAILRDEPEARTFAKAIASTNIRRVSAVNYVEAAAVIDASRNPVRVDGWTISSAKQNSSLRRLLRHKRGLPAKPIGISARAVVILRV